jgi:hypothetical protein
VKGKRVAIIMRYIYTYMYVCVYVCVCVYLPLLCSVS